LFEVTSPVVVGATLTAINTVTISVFPQWVSDTLALAGGGLILYLYMRFYSVARPKTKHVNQYPLLFAVVILWLSVVVDSAMMHSLGTEPNTLYANLLMWGSYGLFTYAICVATVRFIDYLVPGKILRCKTQ